MSPAQRRVAEDVFWRARARLSAARSCPLLRSPELADRVQQLGLYFRFETKLAKPLKELAILVTARHWDAQFEWYAHRKFALEAGLDARDLRRHRARRAASRIYPRTRRWFTTMQASF